MKDMYLIAQISKQGHSQAIGRLEAARLKEPVYIGLLHKAREFHPGMGLRTIYEQFEPEGIGRDAFIVLGLQEGFRLKTYQSPIVTTRGVSSRYRNLLVDMVVTDVNQVWVSDISYYQLDECCYYIVLLMDVYSRRILGYSGADNMRASNNLAALGMALTLRGVDNYNGRLIHHSDRGSQYTSDAYTEQLGESGIAISMCTNVLENAHCERLNGTIKNDYLHRWGIRLESQFQKALPKAVQNYNNRIHRSLAKMTPIEFEAHIKELDPDSRPKVPIFTMPQNDLNPGQLSLFQQ